MKTMSLIGGIEVYTFGNRRFKSSKSPAGRTVFFLGENGREKELEHAKSVFSESQVLTVKEIHVDRSSSLVEFEEFRGEKFNTVMFADLNYIEGDEEINYPF